MRSDDPYKLKKNQAYLVDLIKQSGNILNRDNMIQMLATLKAETTTLKRTSLSSFIKYLVYDLKAFSEMEIYSELRKKTIIRYINVETKLSPYEVALSLLSKSFLSHYSAMYVHDLTLNEPKEIYINREQSLKPIDKKNSELTQRKIDYAFSKPMRQTRNKYSFVFDNITYTVHLLNSKNTHNTGVSKIHPLGFSSPIRATNIERTLLDCIVRPKYSGGSLEILEAFCLAKEQLNIEKMNDYLKKFNYVYPYEKSIWLLMKLSGYSPDAVKVIERKALSDPRGEFDFYLDYQITNKIKDSEIGIIYPRELGP